MLNLASVASVLQIVTGAAVDAIECHATWVDVALVGQTIGPGALDTPITSVGTTNVVPAPLLAVVRNVKFLSCVNTDPLLPCAIVIQHFDGASVTELFPVTLPPGWMVHYNTDGRGFQLYDDTGALQ